MVIAYIKYNPGQINQSQPVMLTCMSCTFSCCDSAHSNKPCHSHVSRVVPA